MASNKAIENAAKTVELNAVDIQIGAVELKDSTTDARQTIRVDNATATATPTVAIGGAIYKDALDTYADNDASPLHTDVNGRLVTVDQNSSDIKTAVQLIDDAVYADDADWTGDSSKHLLVGGVYATTPNAITDGDVGPIALDADGAVHISDGGNTITVDGTVTETNSADIETAVQLIDDAIYVDDADWTGDTSKHMLVGGVYNSATPNAITDGDVGPIALAADGAVHIDDGGNTITVDGSVSVTGTATTTPLAATGIVVAGDGQIKAAAGTLYGVIVTFDGVTAGDKVEIKNSTDNSGTSLFTVIAQAADVVYTFTPCVGIAYSTGIYSDVTLTGGTCTVSAVFA